MKKNKSIFSIILMLVLCFSLCACDSDSLIEKYDIVTAVNDIEIEQSEVKQDVNDEQVIENEDEDENILNEEVKLSDNVDVHFIDVGQADSILFEVEDKFMLIDAGNNDDGDLVVNYLKKQGVSTIDYLIGTHPHEDHIGGLDDVIKNFDIKTIIMPEVMHTSKTYEDVLDALINKNYSITAPVVGDVYNINNSSFRILSPVSDYGDDYNNWSVGIKFTTGDIDFVLCGDAEIKAEADIVKANKDLDAEVLKLGHHGSSTSSSKVFVDAITPEYAVISVGEGNSYGHPHWETKDMLDERNIQYFRTDQQGTIVAHTDGKNLTWSVQPVVDGYVEPSKNTSTEVQVVEKIETPSIPFTTEGKGVSYVLNTNTKKFHYSDCSSAKKTKESNKEYYTGTRDELINRGYSPCGNCNP